MLRTANEHTEQPTFSIVPTLLSIAVVPDPRQRCNEGSVLLLSHLSDEASIFAELVGVSACGKLNRK